MSLTHNRFFLAIILTIFTCSTLTQKLLVKADLHMHSLTQIQNHTHIHTHTYSHKLKIHMHSYRFILFNILSI